MHLGIDLGTSNSAVAAHNGTALRILKTADGSDVLPSALYLDQRGRRFVGRRAYEQAALTPENVAREFKRLMGTSTPLSLGLGSLSMTPEEVSAEILRTLVGQVTAELGAEEIEGTVVTIPAAFNQMQTEATISAADLAGISPVGLIHEPIAAAMASMATATTRSGQFLVYDLGGGTFDVALVQASSGVVNILAHEGVNMLGGKDFDEAMMSQIISPWLESNFHLPNDYRLHSEYKNLLKRAKLQAEKSKIELSSVETTSIFLADDEIRLNDLSGKEIYLDVDFSRADLERLVSPRIDRTIELCERMISQNGFSSADIDRIVLIGGPSKMPIVRQRVPEILGIPADIGTDPMTAVAIGAAIYAESRDWSGGITARKSGRTSQTVRSGLEIKYDYPARAADESASLRVTPLSDPSGWRLRIDAFDGWSSGEMDVVPSLRVQLPLSKVGENRFRATISASGESSQTTELVVTRTFASSAGVPATLTICVAVEKETASGKQDVLTPLIVKGEMLPARGKTHFAAGRRLVGGSDDQIDIRVYQAPDGIIDPALSLLIGSFALRGSEHLMRGDVVRQGDAIELDWSMDDSGILDAKISLPGHSLAFEMGKFFSPRAGHKDFGGEEGAQLADGLIGEAAAAVEEASGSLADTTAWTEIQKLKRRVEIQNVTLAASDDPDARRQAAEESLAIRQEVARLKAAPENRTSVVSRELAQIEEVRESLAGALTGGDLNDRADQLAANARRHLDEGRADLAETCVSQIKGIVFGELMRLPEFIVDQFERLMQERYSAVDKTLHAKLVETGLSAINSSDWEGLRRINFALADNQFNSALPKPSVTQLAGLVKK